MELKGAVGQQGEEEKKHHDGSFQKYMEGKIQKLDVQFQQQSSMVAPVETDPVLSKLFRGVSIHVNGYTEPSHSFLKQMMAQ
jgi:DNA repair protein REV1